MNVWLMILVLLIKVNSMSYILAQMNQFFLIGNDRQRHAFVDNGISFRLVKS